MITKSLRLSDSMVRRDTGNRTCRADRTDVGSDAQAPSHGLAGRDDTPCAMIEADRLELSLSETLDTLQRLKHQLKTTGADDTQRILPLHVQANRSTVS